MVVSELFPGPETEKAKLRVLNPTEGTVVTPDVVEIDTARETFSAVAQRLKDIASAGILLNPYRGIPKVSWMPELDIVYLDEQLQVLRSIEGYKQASMELPEMHASTAIVLPAGRLSAARIQFGDQLELRDTRRGGRYSVQSSSPEAHAAADLSEKSSDQTESQSDSGTRGLSGFVRRLFLGEKDRSVERPRDRRRGGRHVIPGSVAYFSIGNPRGQEVANISTDGFYVRTEDRWSPGTSLLVALQIVNPASRHVEAAISVQSKVVRSGPDGVGFVYDDDPVHRNPMLGVVHPEQLVQLRRFMERIEKG